ncbi:MAG: Ig-like domain-containing protein, partial [Chitinophagales bacterium]
MKKFLRISLFIAFALIGLCLSKIANAQCTPNTIAFNGNQPIYNTACGNTSYQTIVGSTPTGPGVTYQYKYSFNGGAYTNISAPAGTGRDFAKADITAIITANGNLSGTYSFIRIVNQASSGCTSTSNTVYLYYASSAASVTGGTLSGTNPVCSGSTGTITLTGNTGNVLQYESSPTSTGTFVAIPGSGSSNTYTYSNLTANTCYRALVDNVCGGTAGSIDASDVYSSVFCVTVNPLPTISGTPTVCVGSTTQLTGSGTAAATNPYTSSNTAVATVSNTGSVTGVSAGSSTITYTNSNGCSETVSVTVNAKPTISGTPTVCVGSTT